MESDIFLLVANDNNEFCYFKRIFASLVIFILAPLGLIYLWILFKNLKLAKGEFEFIPSNNSRLKFVLVAILGGLILPLGVGATIVLVSINPSKQLARS